MNKKTNENLNDKQCFPWTKIKAEKLDANKLYQCIVMYILSIENGEGVDVMYLNI